MICNKLYNIFCATKTCTFMFKEYVLYLCGREKNKGIFNTISYMSGVNVIYVKFMQALSTRGSFFTCEQLEYMKIFSDTVPYDKSHIDHTFYKTLN